jgi:hypothetical protein
MSNLNRHIRRCVLKPVHTTVALCNQSASSASTNSPETTASSSESPANTQPLGTQVNMDHGPSSSNTSCSSRSSRHSVPTNGSQPKQTGQKRRRRAPSPSRWIPPSLLSFNLSPPEAQKATPVPLPPVKRNPHKGERETRGMKTWLHPRIIHVAGRTCFPVLGLDLDWAWEGKTSEI